MIFRAIWYIFFSFPFIALALRARAISRQLEKYIPYCPHNHMLTSTYSLGPKVTNWKVFILITSTNMYISMWFQTDIMFVRTAWWQRWAGHILAICVASNSSMLQGAFSLKFAIDSWIFKKWHIYALFCQKIHPAPHF